MSSYAQSIFIYGFNCFSSICDFNGCFTFYTLFLVNRQIDVFMINFDVGQWAHTCKCMLFDT